MLVLSFFFFFFSLCYTLFYSGTEKKKEKPPGQKEKKEESHSNDQSPQTQASPSPQPSSQTLQTHRQTQESKSSAPAKRFSQYRDRKWLKWYWVHIWQQVMWNSSNFMIKLMFDFFVWNKMHSECIATQQISKNAVFIWVNF